MKERTKEVLQESLPYIIAGGILICGGLIMYKIGYSDGAKKGIGVGSKAAVKAIADHLSKPNNFCIYDNSNKIPTFISGINLKTEADAVNAMKMLDIVAPSPSQEIFDKSVKSLVDHVFGSLDVKTIKF